MKSNNSFEFNSFLYKISGIFVKFLFFILTFLYTIISSSYNATAFFTQNYRKNVLQGVFKKELKSTIYFNVSTSYLPKTWIPSLSTFALPKESVSNTLSSSQNNSFNYISNKWTYSLTFGIGYNPANSGIRHEFQVEWYNNYSNTIAIGNDDIEIIKEDNSREIIKAMQIGDNFYANIGSFSTNVKLTYNLFYNFQNVFTFMSVPWDIYLGLGMGLSVINGGLYSTKTITSQTSTDDNNNTNTYYYLNENSVNNIDNARSNNITRNTFFAITYQGNIGLLADISQSFAMNLGLHFGATSRPLLTSSFKQIENTTSGVSHLEFHIALQLGILVKALSI